MRPVRNVMPRVIREEEDISVPRLKPKKGPGGKGRAGSGVAAARPAARGDRYNMLFSSSLLNYEIYAALMKVPSEPGIIRAPSAQPVRRKRQVPVDVDSDMEGGDSMESPATLTSANHNKYCHFCQHVKVMSLLEVLTALHRSNHEFRRSAQARCWLVRIRNAAEDSANIVL